ncbi:response regulator [Plantibacter sp. YIM 135347]|uniref:response regulator n=1 Tax=Plantibacter sp. YIM 135347 TaxID=3423919 RepID=UPI003D34E902
MTITIVIADDQAMVRAGFAALLDAQPGMQVVGQAQDGAECVALVHELHPDVVLMDVRMPVLNGIDATRQLLGGGLGSSDGLIGAGNPTGPASVPGAGAAPGTGSAASPVAANGITCAPLPRIIMLTTFDIDDYVYEALRAGASGFLLKDALPGDLVSAVQVVARGDALLAPSITRRMIEQFAKVPAEQRPTPRSLVELTEREREVLILVAKGLSNQEAADELFIAEQTVKTHVSRIFAKLQVRDRAQAVIAAYESGLVVPSAE